MWILFGNKTRVRPVPGGMALERHCDECNQVRRFVECDVADKVSVFFVSLFDMKNRRLVCPECGDDHEVPPASAARASSSTPPPAAARRAAPAPRASDRDVEKMLANLKKKMGK
jgi:hypothetical protein